MASNRNISVGAKIDGNAKGFKSAADEARRASEKLKRDAVAHSKEMERKFKDLTMVFAKIGGAVLVAQKAFQVFSKAMNVTEGSADKLEATMAYLKGGMQGFVESIVTDNLKDMSDLMKEAASASRNLAIELDKLADVQAGGKLKGGFLDERLQTLRVQIAGTTDAKQRAAYIQEAINISKEIAASEIDIKQDEITAYVRYYATRLGIDEKYYKEFQSLVTTIAKDWRYYDSEAFKATMESRINVLKNYTSELTSSQSQELRRYENIKNFLDVIYNPAKDDMSAPGGWNDFVGLLTEIVNLSAQGAESIRRLMGQLTTASKDIQSANPMLSGITGGGMAGAGSLSQIENMNKLSEATMKTTQVFVDYEGAISMLEGTLDNLFRSSMEGWEALGETFKNVFQDMMAKLLSLIATYTILNILSGGSFSMSGLGSFIKEGFGITPSASGGGGGGGGVGTTMLKGRDIAIASNRSSNIIFKNT